MIGRITIVWLASFELSQGEETRHTLCQDVNINPHFSNGTGIPEASGFLLSNPVPANMETKCKIKLEFNFSSEIKVTLMKVLIWSKTHSPDTNAYGWKLVFNNGERQMSWSPIQGGESWKNASAESCPYLHVKDESMTSAPLLNISQRFRTSVLFIELDGVPASMWCDIVIKYEASATSEPTTAVYQTSETFYSESSASDWTLVYILLSLTLVIIGIVVSGIIMVLHCRKRRQQHDANRQDCVYAQIVRPPLRQDVSLQPTRLAAEKSPEAKADAITESKNEPLYFELEPSYRRARLSLTTPGTLII